MIKIISLFLITLVTGCASPTPHRLWGASSIAEYPSSIVLFKTKPKGKVISGVYTADVRNMILIKERVENAAGSIRSTLLIEDSGEPNGFSFIMHGQPMIAVNVGMINLLGNDSDAMAALFGHELAHLYLEHGNQRQKRNENSMMASIALSFTLGLAGIPAPAEVTDVATSAISNVYTRDEERDADWFGVGFITQAGFDAWGAVRLQEKLRDVSKNSPIPFMSSHPGSDERIKNMKQMALEQKSDPNEPPMNSRKTNLAPPE